MEPLKRSNSRSNRVLARHAQSMALCNAQVRAYAICVSSKGVAVAHQECQKQFMALLTCVNQNKARKL